VSGRLRDKNLRCMCVFQGAVLMGHRPESIVERVAKYTYGINFARKPYYQGRVILIHQHKPTPTTDLSVQSRPNRPGCHPKYMYMVKHIPLYKCCQISFKFSAQYLCAKILVKRTQNIMFRLQQLLYMYLSLYFFP